VKHYHGDVLANFGLQFEALFMLVRAVVLVFQIIILYSWNATMCSLRSMVFFSVLFFTFFVFS